LVSRPVHKMPRRDSGESRWPTSLASITLFYALVLSIFGAAEVVWGGRGFILAVSATVFSTAAIATGALAGLEKLPSLVRAGMVLFVGICLLQIVPLPPAIWTALPGNEKRAAVLAVAGMRDAWMPLTQTPIATSYGALIAISISILLCGLVAMSRREFRLVVWLVLVMSIVGIAIGIVQVATSGQGFAFYKATDAGALVGFYANKNHMALAMVCSVALAYLLSTTSRAAANKLRVAFVGYWAFVALLIPLTNSRAGLALVVVVSAMLSWSVLSSVGKRAKLWSALAAIAVLAVLFFAPLPSAVVGRLDSVADDLRWPMLLHSLEIWRIYWLFGSGLGSFADVFMTHEKVDWLFPTYVNNVHNDYVQLGIEMGILGLAAVAIFAAGIAGSVHRALRSHGTEDRAAAVAGLAITLAFALHSVADYPMRRPAALLLFVIGVAAICRQNNQLISNNPMQANDLDRMNSPRQR